VLGKGQASEPVLPIRRHLEEQETALRTSVIASGIGGMVACYFAIATAELLPPGRIEWIWKGGLYGAMFGIPIAAVL